MRRSTPPLLSSSYLPIIGPVCTELRREITPDHFIGRHTSPSVPFSPTGGASERACSQSFSPRASTPTISHPSVRRAEDSARALCACHRDAAVPVTKTWCRLARGTRESWALAMRRPSEVLDIPHIYETKEETGGCL